MTGNDLLGIAGLVVGLIGIIVSVFLYFRSKNRKILEWEMNSTQLIDNSTQLITASVQLKSQMTISIPNLKVTIDDHPIQTLVLTTIKFFNAGNQSIVLSDFAIKEPLGITISGRLYNYDVSADNPNSTPDLQSIDGQTFCIKFDFLKQNQGFSITLLHDGTITVLGELKNGVQRNYRDVLTNRLSNYVWLFIGGAIGFIIGIISIFDKSYLSIKTVLLNVILGIILLILYILLNKLRIFYCRKK